MRRREYTLVRGSPGGGRAFLFRTLAEEEAKSHVEASDGEEEESGDERKVIGMMRENLGRNSGESGLEGCK